MPLSLPSLVKYFLVFIMVLAPSSASVALDDAHSLVAARSAGGDAFAGLYGTYTSDSNTLGYCQRMTNGACTGTCCVLNATLTNVNTPNVTTINFYIDPATASRCGATQPSWPYGSTLMVTGYNSLTRQITAQSPANNPIMANVQVSIAFTPSAYPGFDLTLTPSGGQACTIVEYYVAGSASLSLASAAVPACCTAACVNMNRACQL